MVTAYCATAACVGVPGIAQAPHEVWARLARGEAQNLIVSLDDAAIQAQAAQLRKKKGIAFDDPGVLRFKAERYVALKKELLSALPSGEVQVVRGYGALPMMLLRIRSPRALKSLLAQPTVLRVSEDRKESPMLRRPSL